MRQLPFGIVEQMALDTAMVAVDQMEDDQHKDTCIELLEKEEACLIAMEQWTTAMAQALNAAEDRKEVARAFGSLAATMAPMRDGPDLDKVVQAVQSHGAKAYASLATWEAAAAEADAMRALAEVSKNLIRRCPRPKFILTRISPLTQGRDCLVQAPGRRIFDGSHG